MTLAVGGEIALPLEATEEDLLEIFQSDCYCL